MSVLTKKIENILNGIFILLPGPGMGLGVAGVKNFSMGISNGTPSTAHSSSI